MRNVRAKAAAMTSAGGRHRRCPASRCGKWLILFMVQLTTLLFGMSITLANVVLPKIQGAMSATQDQIAWVVTFNLVCSCRRDAA